MEIDFGLGDRISVSGVAAPEKKSGGGGKKVLPKPPYKEQKELPGEEIIPPR